MSETARLLDDTVDRLLRRLLPDGGASRSAPALCEAISAAAYEASLLLTLVPENDGGLGASLHDAATIAWRWGYHAAPYPIVEGMLAASALNLAGVDASNATLAATAGRDGVFSAPATGDSCKLFALIDGGAAGDAVAQGERTDARAFRALSGEVWLNFTLAQTPARHATPAGSTMRLTMQGALLTAAAIAGGAARIVEMAIDHANTRVQFGRPLGKFQAVQTLIADAAAEQVVSQAALAAAIDAFDGGAAEWPLVWTAKAQAGRAATVVSAAAHQVFGAIGFTEEHALGVYSRRLWTWRDHWGRQADCEEKAGRAASSDSRGLWRHIVDPPIQAEARSQ